MKKTMMPCHILVKRGDKKTALEKGNDNDSDTSYYKKNNKIVWTEGDNKIVQGKGNDYDSVKKTLTLSHSSVEGDKKTTLEKGNDNGSDTSYCEKNSDTMSHSSVEEGMKSHYEKGH